MSLPTLDEVIEIIKAGDKKKGRELLANIVQADLENEKAWLWLSSVVDSDQERRKYLNRVLEINPDNRAAKRGLAILNKKQGGAPKKAEVPAPQPQVKSGGSLADRVADRQKEQQSRPKQMAQSQPEVERERVESRSSTEAAPQEEPADPSEVEPSISAVEDPAPSTVEASLQDLPQQEYLPEDELPTNLSEVVQPEQFEPSQEETVEPEDGSELESPDEDRILAIYYRIEPNLPAPVRPIFQRLAQSWETEQGKTIIGFGLVGLFLFCAACAICGLVFQPVIVQVPPTLAAIVGTETPTPTSTPIPPTLSPTPTLTPTATDTPTPTPLPTNTRVVFDTPTVTATPTTTATPIPPAKMIILGVNNVEEYVDIQNVGGGAQDLTGWRLVSELDDQECFLAGVVQPDETLRIWALIVNADQGGINCGYDQEIWHDIEPDAALLFNIHGQEVDRLDPADSN